MDPTNIEVLLGTLLRKFSTINEEQSKVVHIQGYKAFLLARMGRFSEAFDILKKLKTKSARKWVFPQITQAYKASFTSSDDWPRIKKLKDISLLIETDWQAALLWVELFKYWEDYLALYLHCKNTTHLEEIVKIIQSNKISEASRERIFCYLVSVAKDTKDKKIFDRLRRTLKEYKYLNPRDAVILWIELFRGSQIESDLEEVQTAFRKLKAWSPSDHFEEIEKLIAEITHDQPTLDKIAQLEKIKQNSFIELLRRFRETGEEEILQQLIDLVFNEVNPNSSLGMIVQIVQAIDSILNPEIDPE